MNTSSMPEKTQQLSIDSWQANSAEISWFKKITNRLSISNKIIFGYTLVLSVALFGTTAGVMVGNYYENQAKQKAEKWHEKGILLSKLQVAVLQSRSHQQQLIGLVNNPEEYQQEHEHFINQISHVKELIAEIDNSPGNQDLEYVRQFFQIYDGTTENYLQQLQILSRQIQRNELKTRKVQQAQQILLKFTNSEIALKYDKFSDDLSKIVEAAFAKENETEAALEQAEIVQIYVPIASMVVSVVLASILAIYTSRAIARPLKTATKVAREVTQNANFNLQVPVTTEDEVGVLSKSINQLIAKVKDLLEEEKAAIARQEKMQEAHLLQTEKMSSLGRILAGVAHEINNPVNFIYGNLSHAKQYVEDLLEIVRIYQNETKQTPLAVERKSEEIDLDFLQQDLPKVLQSMTVGADRVRQIIFSLKDFSRLDEVVSQSVDLHACIDSTLLILQNRLKKGITVIRNYGDIPEIEGYTGFLYQVFMNLLSNAIDALEEQLKTDKSPRENKIIITTERPDKNWVMVRIADNGSGISPENQHKIFDTFFTTKPRGVGTGLGLAISRQIIEEKHGGRIACTSAIGEGTELAISLPIKHDLGLDRELLTNHPQCSLVHYPA